MQNAEFSAFPILHFAFCILHSMTDRAFRRLYALVIAELALTILTFYLFTRIFQ